ncbi:MAG: HEAT repeat domain-containing protein [Phycisphaeraceae bacterium]|nr:HEAT repeat domain-containing protein [Phycisphaeraceae bacterium]
MTRPDQHARRRLRAAAALCAAPLLLAGCEWLDDARAKGGTGDSVLEFFQPPSPQQAIAWAADPFDADKRYRGLLLISNSGFGSDSLYVRMYEQAAADGDSGVRAMAARALGRHGGPQHTQILVGLLADDSELVRWEGARALQRVYAPQAVGALLERVAPEREISVQVRESVVVALGQYAEPRVVQALFSALNDRRLSVNMAAHRSLVILTGEDFGLETRDWIRWYNASAEPFANRGVYEYPIFHRDSEWWEYIVPWSSPPNEVAGRPAGAPVEQPRPASQPDAAPANGSTT